MNRGSTLLVGLCLLTHVPGVATAPTPETPELELLEFLGEWSDEGEEWLKQQEKLRDEKPAAAPQKAEVKSDE